MTITYEILNEQVLVILRQLEQLQLLRVKQEEKPIVNAARQPKRRWAGSISKEDGKLFLQHVETMRNESDRLLD